jgi:hypothetical protein
MHNATPTIQATLELELMPPSDTMSPAGALLTLDGERHAFAGWLELAAVIEKWRQTHEHADQPTARR